MRRHAKAIVAISALLLLTGTLGATLAGATAPSLSIDAPSSVSYISVHVSGKVDPKDQETSYYFQYSNEPANEFAWQSGASQGPLAANSGEANVFDDLTGLSPSTEYFVRLVAESADGQSISSEPHPSFTTDAVGPAAVSIDAPSAITSSGAHFSGTIDPEAPGGNPAAFDVSWSFQCTPGCPGLTGGTIPADSASHTVEAEATGLKPGTAYEVTLVATNAGGSASAGPEGFTTTTTLPLIESTNVHALSTEASLEASLNPGGLMTSYHFEYGPTSSYGQTTTIKATPAAGIPVAIRASIFDLIPGATYHFRAVATNSLGTVPGSDRTFTTQSAAGLPGSDPCPNATIRAQQGSIGLPECRGYELISPAEKGGSSPIVMGGELFFGVLAGSPDGERALYASSGAFADATSNVRNQYRSYRTESGWRTEAATPPPIDPDANAVSNQGTAIWAVASDSLRYGLITSSDSGLDPLAPPPSSPVQCSAYLTAGGTGPPVLVSRGNGEERTSGFCVAERVSEDGAHALFSADTHLLPEDAGRIDASDIYDRWGNHTHLVSVGPSGALASTCGANLGSARDTASENQEYDKDRNAVTPDGSRVIFSVPAANQQASANSDCSAPSHLYMRVNNEYTLDISATQRSIPDPAGAKSANFAGAARDGNRVYFTSEEMLTDDATPGGGLYEYRPVNERLRFLPVGATASGMAIIGVDDSGVHVYFTSPQALVPGATGGLGFYDLTDSGLRYIPTQAPMEGNGSFKMSATGNALTFSWQQGSLTGFDNHDTGGASREEVYYLAPGADQLLCISCDPASQRPRTGVVEGDSLTPFITADGDAVAFIGGDQLVPEDKNRKPDVYLYRDSKLALISSGSGPRRSNLFGLSADGSSVFFGTADGLVPEDRDNGPDAYVARVGGGFAESTLKTLAPCREDSCQGALTEVSAASRPGSELLAAGRSRRKVKTRMTGIRTRGAKARVTIDTPSRGEVVAFGHGLRPTRMMTRGGGCRLELRLKPEAETLLKATGRYATAVKVTVSPYDGNPTRLIIKLKFRSLSAGKGR